MSIKVYYINLDRSPDRKAFMEKQLNKLGLPYERISAVDGRSLDFNNLDTFAVRSRIEEWSQLLTPNMVACSLSHYEIYKKIVQEDIEYALILEDDIELQKELLLILSNIKRVLNKEDAFLIYFHGDTKLFSGPTALPIVKGYSLYKAISVWGAYSTGGYIISKEVAKKLLDYVFPVHTTPDSWGMFYRDGVIKGLWGVLPLVTSSANFGSDIGYHKYNKLIRNVEKLPLPGIKSLFSHARRIFKKGTSTYKLVPELPKWDDQ